MWGGDINSNENVLHNIKEAADNANILDFIDEMLAKGIHPNQFIMNHVYEPIEQSVWNVTKSMQNKILKEVHKRMITTNKEFFLYKVYEEMVVILNKPLIDTSKSTLYNTLMDLDKKRKLNSRDIFPEIYNEE
mgnify:CR=1 FL=1